tara:strand:- start:174 stop:359 length:186 start_codon:yes stop_codon:yes gene_type:complete
MRGDSWRECPNYERYWVEDTRHGHKITILFADGTKDEINLKWPDRIRDRNGRVSDLKKKIS